MIWYYIFSFISTEVVCAVSTAQMHAAVSTCACVKLLILWKEMAWMEAVSPCDKVWPTVLVLGKVRGLYHGGGIPCTQGCSVFSIFSSSLLNMCFSSQRGKEKMIPLAQGLFLRFWWLGTLSGTWQDITSVVLVRGNCPGASLTDCWCCWAQRSAILTPAAEENWRKSGATWKIRTLLEILL